MCPGEVVTVGLDKLADRLPKYYEQGARFAKWRAVIDIGAGIPTHTCIHANAHALARYAALCQAAQIVPIVEPEVLMDGDHDIDRCVNRSPNGCSRTHSRNCTSTSVALEGMVLKPNMVVSGQESGKTRATVEEVAEKTVKVLKNCVPGAVPGIAFLSGGQSDEEATAHLDAMNKIGNLPWALTFSYGRALQHAPQTTWSGKTENVAAAQRAFSHRAKMNGLAALGQWKADLEKKSRVTTRPFPIIKSQTKRLTRNSFCGPSSSQADRPYERSWCVQSPEPVVSTVVDLCSVPSKPPRFSTVTDRSG